MGRTPCCAKVGLQRGAWSSDEDKLLTNHIQTHGEGQWRSLPSKAGLLRCGKSCRLRWMNYLRPGIKRGNFTSDENDVIFRLHSLHGNRWSLIATELPGRTDNEIKNHWNAHLRKAVETAGNHQQKVSINKKVRKKRKLVDGKEEKISQEKSKKVKLGQPDTSSSSCSSSSMSLSKKESCDSGMVSGASSSSSTIDLKDGEFDFPWSNWMSLLEVEGTQDEGFLMDGCDLLLSNDDEGLMLEKVYDEYLNLLNDEDGEEINKLIN